MWIPVQLGRKPSPSLAASILPFVLCQLLFGCDLIFEISFLLSFFCSDFEVILKLRELSVILLDLNI
jgi:hypothetical protein